MKAPPALVGVVTLPRPVSRCHSPFIAACMAQLLMGPAPRQVSLEPQVRHVGGRQSVLVAHGRWHCFAVLPRKRHEGRSGFVQSASVEHAGPVAEQVLGATGTTGFRRLLISIDCTVRRTCVSGVSSRRHPAKIVPAKPVGRTPCTFLVIRTVTSTCGTGSKVRLRVRTFAPTPPGAG